MTTNKTCKHCGLTLHLRDREGDTCLQCLASLRPHTRFHENTFNYSTIEGCIRQSTNNPIEKTNNNETEKNPTEENKRDRIKDS